MWARGGKTNGDDACDAPCVVATAAGSRRGGVAVRLLRWCRNGFGSDGGRCAFVMCSHVVRTIVVWSRTRSAIHCHTHTTGLHAMTSPPAAPPHHEAPSAAAQVGMPRSYFLGPWGLFLSFYRLLGVRAHATRKRVPRPRPSGGEKPRITEMRRCFIRNQAQRAVPSYQRSNLYRDPEHRNPGTRRTTHRVRP